MRYGKLVLCPLMHRWHLLQQHNRSLYILARAELSPVSSGNKDSQQKLLPKPLKTCHVIAPSFVLGWLVLVTRGKLQEYKLEFATLQPDP
ncbi:hypothetical protein DPMN_051651 [Dreissena polymorpha]|uniref:Uncharacterized protein n=1 Tax=Dreissena polymorpha TaxID=45954 RepID=A0A9D4HMB7_DREPO|nr:hypothetical protein DPMN_051651 [Dreissena polymorpha]